MTPATRALLDEALKLPLDERATIAAELLASLHEAEEAAEDAWAAEIERRAAAVRSGELPSSDWRTVLDRLDVR